jgi:tripeptidyl-peptidase I
MFNLPDATVAGVVGENLPSNPGVEASLDIEYIMGVAPGIPAYFYSQAAFNFWSDITSWLTVILSETKPVLVQSVSYGDQSYTGQPSVTYKNQVDAQFQKVGALGISVIFASGDSGAGCHLCNQASPSYPATSPYVTVCFQHFLLLQFFH